MLHFKSMHLIQKHSKTSGNVLHKYKNKTSFNIIIIEYTSIISYFGRNSRIKILMRKLYYKTSPSSIL